MRKIKGCRSSRAAIQADLYECPGGFTHASSFFFLLFLRKHVGRNPGVSEMNGKEH